MSPPAAATTRMANPYAKTAQKAVNMGRQSQQRVSNQNKRKFKLAGNNNPKKRGQQTLFGGNAFDAIKDCQVCKARYLATVVEGYRVPNRAHHPLCIKNTKTRGKGVLSEQQQMSLEDNKRYKALVAPIAESEKGSSRNLPRDCGKAFFGPRDAPKKAVPTPATTTTNMESEESDLSPSYFCQAVSTLVSNAAFVEKHKSKQAPLAMMAFANEVAEKIIHPKRTCDYFQGLVMEVPDCKEADENPQYHAIVGQRLLLVDWGRTHGLQIPCPDGHCQGTLSNDRTNFSKNKTLFPIFGLEGPPSWCIVMSMVCGKCQRRFDANDGEVLVNLPDYAADAYPVDTAYALPNYASHLSRNTTDVFASLILTYGNGEMCSKLLYNCLNRAYIRRIKSYYSKAKEKNLFGKPVLEYIEKDGCFIKTYPPLGDTIRDMFDEASSTKTNPWRISDYDRHTREMQSVVCEGIFCQDHTFEVVKNYRKRLGAVAAWTCGTQTGEVAAVALVPSTKTEDFAHEATQLTKRPNFKQKFMYSDT